MRRALLMVCAAWGMLGACGPGARPCLEDEECFGGEYCTAAGACAVYDGRRRVGPAPGADAGQVRVPDMSNPFTPNEPDVSFPDGGFFEDARVRDVGEPVDAESEDAPDA